MHLYMYVVPRKGDFDPSSYANYAKANVSELRQYNCAVLAPKRGSSTISVVYDLLPGTGDSDDNLSAKARVPDLQLRSCTIHLSRRQPQKVSAHQVY